MKNPAIVLPDAVKATEYVLRAIRQGDAPDRILELAHRHASRLGGRSARLPTEALGTGKTDAAEFCTDAERAALALTGAATPIAGRPGRAVPDEVWEQAADHFDERQLAAILLMTATTAFLDRLDATIEEPADTTRD